MRNEKQQSPAGSVSVSTVFDALSHPHRRSLLRNLLGRDRPAAVADVARQLAADESDASSATADDVERVYASLYHNHLPRLDEAGIIDYDRDRNAVALTDRGRYLSRSFETAPGG